MAFSLKSPAITMLLAALLAAGLQAAEVEQSFTISKNLDLLSRFPRAAIDPETGNAYVAWVAVDSNYVLKTRIFAALCKLGGNGMYKVKKAQLLSDPDVESQWWCDIAYNPDDHSSLVVWGPAGLHARKFKVNGKPGGGIKFVYNGSANKPVIVYSDSVPVAPANGTGAYLIAYANYNTFTLGLWTVFADANGNKLTTQEKISEGHTFPEGYPAQILEDLNGTYLIAHFKEDPTYGDTVFITRVGDDGSLIAEQRIGKVDPERCSIAQLGKGLYVATFDDENSGHAIQNQLFRKNLKTRKAPFKPMPGADALECCVVKLDDSAYALQVFRQSTSLIYYRLIDTKGRFVGDAKLLKDVDYLWREPHAVCLPGTNSVLLVYSVYTSSGGMEVKGLVFDPTK
jgi:hypothetical protein